MMDTTHQKVLSFLKGLFSGMRVQAGRDTYRYEDGRLLKLYRGPRGVEVWLGVPSSLPVLLEIAQDMDEDDRALISMSLALNGSKRAPR